MGRKINYMKLGINGLIAFLVVALMIPTVFGVSLAPHILSIVMVLLGLALFSEGSIPAFKKTIAGRGRLTGVKALHSASTLFGAGIIALAIGSLVTTAISFTNGFGYTVGLISVGLLVLEIFVD